MFQVKWIWKNLEGCRKRYIFALCSTVILAFMSLGNATIMARIMDTVFGPVQAGGLITEETKQTLIRLIALLIGFTIFRTGSGYLSVITYEICSQKLVYRLRRDIYANMQAQDSQYFSKNRTGDLMTRLTGDMEMVRHTICWVIRMLIECVVMFAAASICFLVTDWLFALSLLAVTPIIFMLTKSFSKRSRPLYIKIRECLSGLNTAAQENISGNRVVKAFAREEYEKECFDEKNREYRDAGINAPMLWLKYAPFIEGISSALSVAVLLVGGAFLIMGRISIGTFALFNSLSWTLSNPMRMLGFLVNDAQRFFVSANKVIELYYARSTIVTRTDAKKPDGRIMGDIEFKNVSLRMHKTEVLKNINLKIEAGQTVAIMGPTGAGKTTLANLIPRLTDPNEGEIMIDDVSVRLHDLNYLRSSIGIATQDVFLFSDSVDGNIAYGDTSLSEEEVKKFAEMADAMFAEKMPEGFDTVIGERGTGLSGGQKQRIALARALAVKPSILILDDTTSAVDMETEKEIQKHLSELDFPCTKVVVAQRISTTKEADKIVIMDRGEIVDMGTHEELIARPGYYQEVYFLQNGIEEKAV
jgi:ABC-type multidrug transport system, ATPase and permease components